MLLNGDSSQIQHLQLGGIGWDLDRMLTSWITRTNNLNFLMLFAKVDFPDLRMPPIAIIIPFLT